MHPVSRPGFSGAAIFRVVTSGSTLCWRRWPRQQSVRRLTELHQLLQHVAASGLAFVPAPRCDVTGRSVIEDDGALWQLEAWMPGAADYWENPQPQRLIAAFEALARWHRAAATIDCRGEWFACAASAQAPSVCDRTASLRSYSDDVMQTIEAGLIREPQPMWRECGQVITTALRWRGPQLRDDLLQGETLKVPLQPVIRDVWHDHVLFTENEVTGLIDYGAARTDTVAADISRLLGSLIGDHSEQRRIALDAYEKLRPLSLNEHRLISMLDLSNVLLSGLVWLRRRYVEHLPIDSESRVLERLQRIAKRLAGAGLLMGALNSLDGE